MRNRYSADGHFNGCAADRCQHDIVHATAAINERQNCRAVILLQATPRAALEQALVTRLRRIRTAAFTTLVVEPPETKQGCQCRLGARQFVGELQLRIERDFGVFLIYLADISSDNLRFRFVRDRLLGDRRIDGIVDCFETLVERGQDTKCNRDSSRLLQLAERPIAAISPFLFCP